MDIPKLIAAQRAYFETGATRDIAVRRRALQALQASVRRHEGTPPYVLRNCAS